MSNTVLYSGLIALLAGGVLVGPGRQGPDGATATAVHAQYPTGDRFLERYPDGNFVIRWEQVEAMVDSISWDVAAGENNHLLIPRSCAGCGAIASIYPAALPRVPGGRLQDSVDAARRQLAQLRHGAFVAKIVSFADFAPLGIRAGTNYLLVWRSPRLPPTDGQQPGHPTHMATLNRLDRTLIGFEFQPHGETSQVPLSAYGGHVAGGGEWGLSQAALTCKNKGWRACFIDSAGQQQQPPPAGAPDGLYGAGLWPEQLFSQPWVSCAMYGCCCGGTQCHT